MKRIWDDLRWCLRKKTVKSSESSEAEIISLLLSLTHKFKHPHLKIGPFPASFFFIFVFSIQLKVHVNFAYDSIRTADLWSRKRPLYQLRYNHFPTSLLKPLP